MLQRLAFAALLLAGVSAPALAQKAQDTVRVAVHQPTPIIDPIYNPSPETSLISNHVFDSLVHFDGDKREYMPLLAESWKRIDGRTFEFKLRQGIKWHDGEAFDADDVVYSLEAFIDPKNAFRFKDSRFGWIEKVEKVDGFTVRIVSKEVMAPFLGRFTSTVPIYPEHLYRKLENKGDFGRNPVGTGPYKVVSFDPAKGEIAYEKVANYPLSSIRSAGHARRITVSSIPDKQTQMAKLLSGGIDVIYEVETDMIQALRANPNLAISVERTVSYTYIQFDSANRSGVNVFKDKRVREALLKAIDRPALLKAFLPAEHQKDTPQPAMCHEWHIGCASSAQPVAHDLDGAKKLLAEAGFPNGFELALTTWGPSRRITEAVAGQLRRVGINAKVDASVLGVFVQKRADGKIQTMVSLWDNGVAQPDIESTVSFFFPQSSRDLMGDPILAKVVDEGRMALDPKEREAIYRAGFDRITNERYMMPLVPLPAVVAHHKDVRLVPGHKSPEGVELNHVGWK